jgi:UDP-2,4-diacetamido-2,4,6-trideoxy-beta-L-altropyranose hydrolase
MTDKMSAGANFLFRCDVSPQVGMGHLKRCMVLADELKQRGSSIFFILRSEHFNAPQELKYLCDGLDFLDWRINPIDDARAVVRLHRKYRIRASVIDHYRGDEDYQTQLHNAQIQWLQFDSCRQKRLWANWVLDPTLASEQCDYQSARMHADTVFLLGPRYALLRQEFSRRQSETECRPLVKKILLTFGGGDDGGVTVFALEALQPIDPRIERVVLVSSANPRIVDIQNWIQTNSTIATTLRVDEKEIASRMSEADIAITAGGMTTFETAAMGLPTLIVQIADNQRRNAMGWQKKGVAADLGPIDGLDHRTINRQTADLIGDYGLRRQMSNLGKNLVDGLGTRRVARILYS